MENICSDLWRRIMQYCYVNEQLSIMQTCKELYYNSYIYNLDIDIEYKSRKMKILLTNDIFEQIKFSQIQSLNLHNINNIHKLNHLVFLKELIVSNNPLINDSILKQLTNLETLDVKNCPLITNINYLTKLEKLNISGELCGVDDYGISKLNLKHITIIRNNKISTINHMTNLEYVFIVETKINNCGITNINPIHLYVYDNSKLTEFNHMTNLKHLVIHKSDADNDDLKNLNLKSLEIYRNNYITDINHMTNLKKLELSCTLMSINGFKNLKNIKYLDLMGVTGPISDLNQMTKIKTLRLSCMNITKDCLEHINPQILYLKDIDNEIDISHMNNIREIQVLYGEMNDKIADLIFKNINSELIRTKNINIAKKRYVFALSKILRVTDHNKKLINNTWYSKRLRNANNCTKMKNINNYQHYQHYLSCII